MIRHRRWTILLSAFFLAAGIAYAQNVKYVSFSPVSSRTTYTAGSETPVVVTATFKLDKGVTDLSYYATFDPPQAARLLSNGLDTIPFEIFDSSTVPRNILLDEASAVYATDVLAGVFPTPLKNRGPEVDRTFAFVVMPGGFAPAGSYSGIVSVSLWNGPFKSGVLLGSAAFDATVTVNDILEVSIVPPGAPFDYMAQSAVFDFGFLESGSIRSADLVARANTTYGISLTSANGGIMSYEDPADPSMIPYEFRVDGTPLTLAAGIPAAIVSGAAATTADGRRFRLDAQILTFDFPTEGFYSDIITVSILKN